MTTKDWGNTTWIKVLTALVTGGHTYWLGQGGLSDGCIAVADDSMRRPDDPASTDDGLVLVDRPAVRSVGITLTESRWEKLTARIPCLDYQNEEVGVGASTREAVALAQYLDVPLRLVVDGVTFVPDGKVAP